MLEVGVRVPVVAKVIINRYITLFLLPFCTLKPFLCIFPREQLPQDIQLLYSLRFLIFCPLLTPPALPGSTTPPKCSPVQNPKPRSAHGASRPSSLGLMARIPLLSPPFPTLPLFHPLPLQVSFPTSITPHPAATRIIPFTRTPA